MIASLAMTWWQVCKRPLTSVFLSEIPKKSNIKTLIGVCAAGLLGLVLSWLMHLWIAPSGTDYMGLASMWVRSGTPPPFATWPLLVLVGIVAGFYDFEIVLFLFARLLGGTGSFGRQAYLQSLFYAPLAIVQQIVVETPVVARLLFALVAVLSLIPTTTSLRAAHGYSGTRAVLTWVAPIVLNVLGIAVVVALVSFSRG